MNIKDLTVSRRIAALIAGLCLAFLVNRAEAQQGLPSVTIMQAGSGEFERDLEAVMKLAGKKGEEQWPVIQAILPAFNQGIDPARPIRVDVIFGAQRDYRLSIPYINQKAILGNVAGFIGAKPRRVGTDLYLLKSPAFNGFLRDLKGQKYVIIAADRKNLPPNFNPLPDIQPLIAAGYDMAALVKNTAQGRNDRVKAIDDLRKELLDALKKTDDETDEQFEIRRVGLIHQLKELERLFADSENLVLGWTTDAPKKEGRLALELTALADTDLAASVSELGAKASLFSAIEKSDDAIFFGRINHSLDGMRKKHISEMLKLLEGECVTRFSSSDKVEDANKEAAQDAVKQFYAMLEAGNQMGVIDGFVDIAENNEGRSIVGAIRSADGNAAADVLAALKSAGWEVELAETPEADSSESEEAEKDVPESTSDDNADSAPAADSEDATDEEKKPEQSEASQEESSEASEESTKEEESAKEATSPSDESPTKEAQEDTSSELAIHTLKIPASRDGDLANLFGADAKLLVVTTADAVYYATGAGAEERIRQAVAATGVDETKNDGTFLETWTKVGPWIDYLKGRRERREEGQDLSKLSEEEKKAREERIELRDMAINAFAAGNDTIHTKMQSDQKKVTGLTTFAEGILRFVGTAISDFAASKLQ